MRCFHVEFIADVICNRDQGDVLMQLIINIRCINIFIKNILNKCEYRIGCASKEQWLRREIRKAVQRILNSITFSRLFD